ncbi:hypothetical protein ACSBR2_011069 [Camellia fascicularis]
MGETISWAFVRYLNDLTTVRMYDWTSALLTILMGSVKEFHRTAGKVTGCVVVLLFWLCEHSDIVQPKSENMFPRFLKWDIGELLSSCQGVDLSRPVKFQVKVDRLRSFKYEREVMGLDIEVGGGEVTDVVDGIPEEAGGSDSFVEEGNQGNKTSERVVSGVKDKIENMVEDGDKCGENVHWPRGDVVDVSKNVVSGSYEGGKCAGVDGVINEQERNAISALENDNKLKDSKIAMLEVEASRLKRENEMQVICIIGGFWCVLKMKDEEVEKLKKESMDLRKQIAILEDQLADRDVHDVTQAFRTVEVDCNVGGLGAGSSGVGGEGFSDVTPLRAVGVCVNNFRESDLNLGTDDRMVQVDRACDLNMFDSKQKWYHKCCRQLQSLVSRSLMCVTLRVK